MTLHRNSILDMSLLRDTITEIVNKNKDNNTGVMFGMLLMLIDNVLVREGAMDDLMEFKKEIADRQEETEEVKTKMKAAFKGMTDDEKNASLALVYQMYRNTQRKME